jgi:hypothetical protein
MTSAPIEDQDDKEEMVFTFDLGFIQAQEQGKCGEVQGNGARCASTIREWIDLDPDRPWPNGPRVGACGTHIADVARRAINLRDNTFSRRADAYVVDENIRIARTLRKAGVEVYPGTARRPEFRLLNPGEFLHTLEKLGVLEQFGLSLDEPQCPAVKVHAWDERRNFRCQEAQDHYGMHDNWDGTTWEDEVMPEPEPTPVLEAAPDEGAQFS